MIRIFVCALHLYRLWMQPASVRWLLSNLFSKYRYFYHQKNKMAVAKMLTLSFDMSSWPHSVSMFAKSSTEGALFCFFVPFKKYTKIWSKPRKGTKVKAADRCRCANDERFGLNRHTCSRGNFFTPEALVYYKQNISSLCLLKHSSRNISIAGLFF